MVRIPPKALQELEGLGQEAIDEISKLIKKLSPNKKAQAANKKTEAKAKDAKKKSEAAKKKSEAAKKKAEAAKKKSEAAKKKSEAAKKKAEAAKKKVETAEKPKAATRTRRKKGKRRSRAEQRELKKLIRDQKRDDASGTSTIGRRATGADTRTVYGKGATTTHPRQVTEGWGPSRSLTPPPTRGEQTDEQLRRRVAAGLIDIEPKDRMTRQGPVKEGDVKDIGEWAIPAEEVAREMNLGGGRILPEQLREMQELGKYGGLKKGGQVKRKKRSVSKAKPRGIGKKGAMRGWGAVTKRRV